MITNRLRIIMAENYLSSTDLAKITGLSRNTINSLKNNKTTMIKLDVLEKICNSLLITPNDFFEIRSDKK